MSTLNQDSESEIQMLKKGCEVIYSEKFTGTKFDRPMFNIMSSFAEFERDTIVEQTRRKSDSEIKSGF